MTLPPKAQRLNRYGRASAKYNLIRKIAYSNDLISVLGPLGVLQYFSVLEWIISKNESLRYRAWVDDAIAKVLAP